MESKSTKISPESIAKMAEQMAEYVRHQSIQYNVSIHYMQDEKLMEQSPTGETQEIPFTTPHSEIA